MHTTEMLCFLREAHRGLRDQDEHFRNTDRLYQGGSERLPFLEPDPDWPLREAKCSTAGDPGVAIEKSS